MRILYFASVRDGVGMGEETLDLPEGLSTAGDLATWLETRAPVFADRARLRVAVDQVMADFDTDIRDAREVAFFPPVTGG
jgi:sulfur-carrier protein